MQVKNMAIVRQGFEVFCISNDEFVSKMMNYVLQTMNYVLQTMN